MNRASVRYGRTSACGCCKVRLTAARAELDRNDGVDGRCESTDVTKPKEDGQGKKDTPEHVLGKYDL